jgi:hypothetical protein
VVHASVAGFTSCTGDVVHDACDVSVQGNVIVLSPSHCVTRTGDANATCTLGSGPTAVVCTTPPLSGGAYEIRSGSATTTLSPGATVDGGCN